MTTSHAFVLETPARYPTKSCTVAASAPKCCRHFGREWIDLDRGFCDGHEIEEVTQNGGQSDEIRHPMIIGVPPQKCTRSIHAGALACVEIISLQGCGMTAGILLGTMFSSLEDTRYEGLASGKVSVVVFEWALHVWRAIPEAWMEAIGFLNLVAVITLRSFR